MKQLQSLAIYRSHRLSGNSELYSFFSKKRVSYIVAGVFLFAASIAIASGSAGDNDTGRQLTTSRVMSDVSELQDTPGTPATGTDPPPSNPPSNLSSSSTRLEVNGQTIPVPANGSTSQTITDNNTTTTVETSNHSSIVQSSSGANLSSSQSSNISVNSSNSESNGGSN